MRIILLFLAVLLSTTIVAQEASHTDDATNPINDDNYTSDTPVIEEQQEQEQEERPKDSIDPILTPKPLDLNEGISDKTAAAMVAAAAAATTTSSSRGNDKEQDDEEEEEEERITLPKDSIDPILAPKALDLHEGISDKTAAAMVAAAAATTTSSGSRGNEKEDSGSSSSNSDKNEMLEEKPNVTTSDDAGSDINMNGIKTPILDRCWGGACASATTIPSSSNGGNGGASSNGASTTGGPGVTNPSVGGNKKQSGGGGAISSPAYLHTKKRNAATLTETTTTTTTPPPPKQKQQQQEEMKRPPDGFEITAAVYTNPEDGLSYFSNNNDDAKNTTKSSSIPQIPFLECNAIGSTTAPLPFKHGSFRHFPSGADPSQFYPTPHPGQLIICLSNIEIIVSGNDEETRVFERGDVILLEDTMGVGHKMRAAHDGDNHHHDGNGHVVHEDMKVLMLALPNDAGHHHHHHATTSSTSSSTSKSAATNNKINNSGGGGWSIFKPHPSTYKFRRGTTKESSSESNTIPHPCKLESDPAFSSLISKSMSSYYEYGTTPRSPFLSLLSNPKQMTLTTVGLTAFGLLTYWLSKVAPPLLSVIFGGGVCWFGGTFVFVKWGQILWNEMEDWWWMMKQGRNRGYDDQEEENDVIKPSPIHDMPKPFVSDQQQQQAQDDGMMEDSPTLSGLQQEDQDEEEVVEEMIL